MMAHAADPPGSRRLPAGSGQPLRCWSRGEADSLAAGVRQVLCAWRTAWGLRPDEAAGPRCERLRALPAASAWIAFGRAATLCAWLQHAGDRTRQLAAVLFDDEPGGPMAREVAALCEADLAARLAAAMDWRVEPGTAHGPPESLVRSWSGALLVVLPLPGALIVDGAAAEQWLAQHGPRRTAPAPQREPVALAEALGGRGLELDARLAGCTLPLRTLQTLQVGDVVPLSHPLAEPLRVTDSAGQPLLGGYLGAHGGTRAIELAAARRTQPGAATR